MTLNIILLVLAQQPCFIEEELACLLLHNWAIHAYIPHSIFENAQKQEKHKGLPKRYIYNKRYGSITVLLCTADNLYKDFLKVPANPIVQRLNFPLSSYTADAAS